MGQDAFRATVLSALHLRDWTQKDLCDKTGIHPSKMSRYLAGTGEIKSAELGEIARELGLKLEPQSDPPATKPPES